MGIRVRCYGDEDGPCDKEIEFELEDNVPGTLMVDTSSESIRIQLYPDFSVLSPELENAGVNIKLIIGEATERIELMDNNVLTSVLNLESSYEETYRIYLTCEDGHTNIYEITVSK